MLGVGKFITETSSLFIVIVILPEHIEVGCHYVSWDVFLLLEIVTHSKIIVVCEAVTLVLFGGREHLFGGFVHFGEGVVVSVNAAVIVIIAAAI